jgi:hypothetical protein
MQAFARHRFTGGLDFTVAYTYGQNIDTYSQDVGDNSVRNPAPGLAQFPSLINLGGTSAAGFQGGGARWVERPILAERGNSDFDIRHNLTVSHIYELPFGRGKRFGDAMHSLLNAFVGNFSLAGFLTLRSGLPVYVSEGSDYADVGVATSPRPALKQGSISDLYANGRYGRTQHLVPKPEIDQYLGIPENVTDPYAVMRRNSLRGPAVQVYDMSVIKKFPISERSILGFEANFFNLLNHAIMGPPVAVVRDARFGRITNTLSGTNPRQIQLALKLTF